MLCTRHHKNKQNAKYQKALNMIPKTRPVYYNVYIEYRSNIYVCRRKVLNMTYSECVFLL